MNNTVNLTDDELSVITTSLQFMLTTYEKFQSQKEKVNLDFDTRKCIQEATKLLGRLDREYF